MANSKGPAFDVSPMRVYYNAACTNFRVNLTSERRGHKTGDKACSSEGDESCSRRGAARLVVLVKRRLSSDTLEGVRDSMLGVSVSGEVDHSNCSDTG